MFKLALLSNLLSWPIEELDCRPGKHFWVNIPILIKLYDYQSKLVKSINFKMLIFWHFRFKSINLSITTDVKPENALSEHSSVRHKTCAFLDTTLHSHTTVNVGYLSVNGDESELFAFKQSVKLCISHLVEPSRFNVTQLHVVIDLSGTWIVRQTVAGGWKRVMDKARGGWTLSQIKTVYFPNDPWRFVWWSV